MSDSSKIGLLFAIFVGILVLTIALIRPSTDTTSDPSPQYNPPPSSTPVYTIPERPSDHIFPQLDPRGIPPPGPLDEGYIQHRYVSDIFADMFSKQDPWVISNENFDRIKAGQMNKFFVSQI